MKKKREETSFFFSDKRADECMSVVAVLRPSYYLVIDLQSKDDISARSGTVVSSQLCLDPAMQL